jgi:iron complex outermembrane receptor protein
VYDGDYPYNYAAPEDPPTLTLFKDEALGEWAGTEWQLTARVGNGHTLVAGVEYRENLREWQTSFDDTSPRYTYFETDSQSRNVGLYGQGEFALTDKLLLNAGLRYDHYFQSFGGTLNPRSALIFSPTERTTWKALYGQAYKAPSAYEQHYFLGVGAPPELDPERIRTYELTFDRIIGRHYRLNLSGYRYAVNNLITQAILASGDVYFQNLDRVSARGVELEIDARYDNGIEARASFALQKSKDVTTNELLTNSPRQLGKMNLGLPIWKLTTGFELQYQGSVRTLAGAQERSFVLGNFTVSSPQSRSGLQVSAGVYNLLDTAYSYPGAADHVQDVIEQDGRSFRVNVRQQF